MISARICLQALKFAIAGGVNPGAAVYYAPRLIQPRKLCTSKQQIQQAKAGEYGRLCGVCTGLAANVYETLPAAASLVVFPWMIHLVKTRFSLLGFMHI